MARVVCQLSSTMCIRSFKVEVLQWMPRLQTSPPSTSHTGRSPALYTRRSQCHRSLHSKFPRRACTYRQERNPVPGIESSYALHRSPTLSTVVTPPNPTS